MSPIFIKPADPRPKRGGWAPGDYMCRCHECEQYFDGDKRAWLCADCAYRIHAPSSAEATGGGVASTKPWHVFEQPCATADDFVTEMSFQAEHTVIADPTLYLVHDGQGKVVASTWGGEKAKANAYAIAAMSAASNPPPAPVPPDDDLPWRRRDIERGLILFRTSNNAHGFTNVSILSDKVDALPQKAKDELAGMMRNIAAGLSTEAAPAPPAPDGWRDIRTAPRNGTTIIYQSGDGPLGRCRWDFAINEDEVDCWWDSALDDEVSPRWWLPENALPPVPEARIRASIEPAPAEGGA